MINFLVAMLLVFTMIVVIFIIFYEVVVLLHLIDGDYKSKKELIKDLIPFYKYIKKLINEFKKLE